MPALDAIQRAGILGRFAGGGAPNGGGGSLLSGTPFGYNPAYGGVPRVPSPTSTASTAIGGNLGNLGSLYGLSTGTGTASGAGVISALNQEIPGVSGSIGAARGGIDELLSGRVPEDVIAQLQQQSAEIGAGRGMGPMAPSTNAEYLRALGLTSLGMKEKGQQELDALMGSVPRAPAFDPSSMMVTPGQEQEWQYLAQVLANAPNPAAAAKANLDALHSGAGIGGAGGAYGGVASRPVVGGPAFPTSPLSGPEDYGYPNMPIYGGTGVASDLSNPTAQGYQNWQRLASQWSNPEMSQEDIYNLGLSPAIEEGGGDYGGSYEDYYGY